MWWWFLSSWHRVVDVDGVDSNTVEVLAVFMVPGHIHELVDVGHQ